jgi:hypothetical protein
MLLIVSLVFIAASLFDCGFLLHASSNPPAGLQCNAHAKPVSGPGLFNDFRLFCFVGDKRAGRMPPVTLLRAALIGEGQVESPSHLAGHRPCVMQRCDAVTFPPGGEVAGES